MTHNPKLVKGLFVKGRCSDCGEAILTVDSYYTHPLTGQMLCVDCKKDRREVTDRE